MQETEVTKIVPSDKWVHLDLKDLWRHRELLYFLTWRDIKIMVQIRLPGHKIWMCRRAVESACWIKNSMEYVTPGINGCRNLP